MRTVDDHADHTGTLDDRKAAILHAVVEEYIRTAQPVGSSRVARASGLGVSPATVRNEMAVLEDEGYLSQPHTSAGRVPTEKGYRFFVDRLRASDLRLDPANRRTVKAFFEATHGELESLLARTSELLSRLTDGAAVVVGPPAEAATVRSAQLVDLSSHVVLLVVVLSSGVVEKRAIEVGRELSPEVVAEASRRLDASVRGRRVDEVAPAGASARGSDDVLLQEALRALADAATDAEVYVGGVSRLASAFDAVEQVREVLSILEQQIVVVSLVRDVLDRGLQVAIGGETGVEPLSECSVVVAPFRVEGRAEGTVGVIGPTRMDYAQAMSAVAVVSRRLGEALSEG